MDIPAEPNWQKWRYMLKARLWQWVSLSLGVNPDLREEGVAEDTGVIMEGEYAEEYRDRMEIAWSHLDAKGRLHPATERMPDNLDHCMIERAVFIEWATEVVRWQLPKEFAGPPAESNPPASDASRKLRALRHLVLGMAVADPYRWDPDAQRSDATGSIRIVLDTAGLSLDDKTIREHLREAFDALSEQDKATVCKAVKDNAAKKRR